MTKYVAKQKRNERFNLQKAVLAMLATGMVAWPSFSPVYATTITRTDSGPAVVVDGNVHKVYAGQAVGNTGVNRFSDFNIDSGHIANLYFGRTASNTAEFNTLMNFVDNRININGTVNAIRGSGVGGHLFFLSPNGMVVGASGAINTGSLTVMTPTNAWWTNKFQNNVTQDIVTAVSAMAVPINASGTIAIQGKINATDDIRIKAGKINIGMDVDDANKTAAALATGVTDFSSVVNLSDLQDASVTTLTAVRTSGSGDIELKAEVSYNENTGADTVNAIVNIAGGSQIKAAKNVTIDAQATNNVGVTIYTNQSNEARYKVGDKDLSKSQFEAQYKNSSTGGFIGSTATLNAKVNITDANTKIEGDVVHIGAEAKNVLTNTFTSSVPSAVTSTIFGVLLNGLDVAYGILTTDAEVNIGVGTEVVAKSTLDKALAVVANAETNLTVGTMDFSFAALTAANPNANLFPAVAFNYASTKNDAKVEVKGTLKADNGGMVVEAVAKNTLNSSAATGLGGVVALPEGAFNFGINIVNGHNRSKVTVEDGAVITARKNLLVQADAISSINVTTSLSTGDNAATAFLVNTFEYDNQAEVDVNSTLTSTDGDVTVNANGIYTDNTFTGSASVGKGALARTVGDILSGSQVINKGLVQNIGNGVCSIIGQVFGVGAIGQYGNFFDKLSQYGLGDSGVSGDSFAKKLHQQIELGLSFGYMDEKNISLVNFGSKGRIVASNGQANVNAISKLDDVFTSLNGASKNASTRLDVTNPNALANGALFMREIANQADVIFEAPAVSSQETITAKNDINIVAKAEAPFNRVSRMKNAIWDYNGLSEADFKESLGTLSDSEKEVLWQAYRSICTKDLPELKNMFDANGNLKPEYMDGSGDYNKVVDVVKEFSNKTDVARFLDLINTGKFTYTDAGGTERTITLGDGQKKWYSQLGSIFSFASPANYTNYAVSALTSGQDNSHGGASSYALAIGVGIDSVENMARIQIGKNNKIHSVAGNVTTDSNTVYGGVALDGSYFPVGGGESGTGGFVVGVHDLNNNSIVALAEQAQITAAQNYSAKAENDVLHIGLGLGLGMSKENTIAGTVQYVGADSNTLISIDDEAVLDANTISLLGDNDTTAVTITGGMAMGNTSAVGVAVGVLDIDRNNLVAIADNDVVGTMTEAQMEIVSEDDESADKTRDDAETRLKKLLAKKSGLVKEKTGEEWKDTKRAAIYGSTSVTETGTVSTNGLDVKAATNGHIVNVTADAGISMSSNVDAAGFGGRVGTFFSNKKNAITNLFGQFDGWVYKKFGGNSTWVPKPTNESATNPNAGEQLPSFSLAATASVAVSDLDVKTAAVVDRTKITFKNTSGNNNLNVQGADNSAIVAVAGGMAFAWKTNTAHPDVTGKSGSFAGGAAVNLVHSDVDAIIQDSTINGAKSIKNTAERSGTLAAAGAAIDISLNTGTSALGMAAGISVNLAENKTIALMKGNTVNDDTYTGTDKTIIENLVTNKDLQVTGALDINAVKSNKNSGSIGVVATWDSVKNTSKAEIDGGTYKKIGAVKDNAVTDLTQINAALGLGVAQGSGTDLAWDFQGSLLVGVFKNTAEANVKNITLMEADSLDVKAYDTDLGTNKFSNYLSARGFDTKGTSYLNDAKTGSEIDDITDKGNLIVTASTLISAAAGGSGGSGGFGAGVVVNEIDNDFLASVDNSTITLSSAAGADILAESNTLAVSVAAGGAGTSKGFCAAGSFVMDFLNNDVYAKVLDSSIDTEKLSVNALQKNKIVNVAGQVSVGRTAIGLDFAYNWMNTNTGAYLTNTKVFKTDGETDITLDAENTAKMYAVSVGIEANTDNGATGNGSVAVNRGHNNVEAAASSDYADKNIVNAKNLVIHSKDDSKLVAAAGGLELGGAVAIGGALTWNRIGDLQDVEEVVEEVEEDDGTTTTVTTYNFISDGKIQVNRASLKGYTVSTTGDAVVRVQAEDEADLTTISVGLGLTTGRISVQGANANAYIDKETSATIEDSEINKGTGNSTGGKVSVLASTDNDLTTTAAVVSVGSTLAVGAGLAENTIKSDTVATLAGGKYALKDLLVKAYSDDYLLNVAVGVAVFGETINVAGSLVFNEIVNNTSAILGKEDATKVTEVEAEDNVGVVSQSMEEIVNHSGQVNVGQKVGSGLAVSSNEIGGLDSTNNPIGNTKAIVQNAKVTAKGKGAAVTVQDSTVYNKDTKKYGTWSGTGVVVNADALHLLTNDTFSGGLGISLGDDALAVGLDGVAGIDRINGITLAKVYASDINEDATASSLSGQNLSVRATDKVDSTAVISNAVADIAPGIGATGSVGVGVSKDVQERKVETVVEGTADRKNVNANKITLLANSLADLTIVNTALSVSFSEAISGSVTTGVCYTDLKETTLATMKNVISYNNGLDILAKHEDNVDIVGTGVTLAISPSLYSGGAAVGVHVDAESNTSKTEATLEGSTIHHYTDNSAEDSIKAENVSDVLTQDANLSVAFSLLSVGVGVMVQDNDLQEKVKTTVKDSTIGTNDKRAKNITVASDNKVTTHFYNENVSGGMAGIGVGVGLNTVDTATITNITNSSLYSRNNIVADAKENISLNGTMVQATVGGLSVGVSTLHNYVNTTTVKDSTETAVWETVKNKQSDSSTGDKEYTAGKIDTLAKHAVDDGNDVLEKINEDSSTGKGSIAEGSKEERTVHEVEISNSGTKVNLAGANLYAAKDITTTAKSTVNSDTDLGGGSVGLVDIQVEVNKQHIKGDVGVNITGGVMNAKGNITLNSLMDGVLDSQVVQAAISGVAVLVTYSNVTKEEGGTSITLDSAKLTTEKDINLLSEDKRTIKHKAIGATSSGIEGSGYDISSRDKAVSKITLQNTLTNGGTPSTPIYTELSAKNINIDNYSKPSVATEIVAASVSVTVGSGVIAESESKNQALMDVKDGVKLLGDAVTLDNGVNNQEGKYTLDTDVTGVFVSGMAVHVNKSKTNSDIKAETTVGAITLKTKQGTDEQGNPYTVGISDLTVNTFDATNIHNDVRGVNVGVTVAVGSNYSQSDLKSTVTTTINAGTEGLNVGKLNVHAKGHDTLKSVANGDGGGVVNISPVAAKVESKITGTTTTTLKGTFNIADDLTAEAMRTDDLTYMAKAVEATIVGGSGTELDINNITETTTLNLNNATINVSGKADFSAHTALNINDDNSYAVRGNGIGGVSVYVSNLGSNITLNNKVNVADSKIYGSKNINLSAYTDGYINLANYDYAVSIVFSNATANTTSTIEVDDGVDITGASEIRTKKAGSDVTVAAYDDLELYLRSYAEVASGLTSGVTTNTTSTLTRNNKINLTSGKIFSTQDVNLLAGKKNNYSVAEMNMRIEAETFSGGLISLYNNPSVTNNIYQKNQIAVAAGAESQSIRHTNLYAGNGRESIYKLSEYHSLVHSGDESEEAIEARYVSTSKGNIGNAVTRDNKVTVNGSVTAGIANNIQIDIGTNAGDWVILDPAEKAMVDANDDHFDDHSGDHPVWGEGDKDKFIHLTDGDGNDKTTFFRDVLGITLDDFILGSENVVQNLTKRLEEVGALLDAYKDDENKTVYNGLVAERDRLQQLIEGMGISTSTSGVNSPRRDYIEIPDLVASGGNVVVETGNFNGSGYVTANGDPSITINNYTNLALVTNSIVVDDPGGIIYYNNKELNPDTTKTMPEQVKELNVSSDTVNLHLTAAKGNSAGAFINGIYNSGMISYSGGIYEFFNNIPSDVDKTKIFFKDGDNKVVDGNNTTVAVKGTDGKWHKGTESGEILSDDFYANASEKTQTIAAGSYDPMADIIIHGNIMTPKGSVTVHANQKNIIVEGKTAKDAVVISGKIVSLKADNGSITQGFTDGIVNIGGTPEDQYAEFYNKAKQEMYNAAEGTKKEYDLITGTPADGQKAPDPAKDKDGNIIGNWIAGGQVYINATDININGVIQSGYETFKADITTAQQQAINNVVTAWKNNGAKALTDTEVKNSGITYRVVEGGAYWNASKGCYDYVVDVFYNPYTGKLVTADVNASGGRVYLTGRISSTGNGKIICLDGAYNIDINNKLNYDLNIGSLVVNDTQGLIQITDSNVDAGGNKKAALVTEIRNGSVVTYSSLDPDHYLSNDRISGSGRKYVYTPVEGLRYNWVTGYKSTSYRRYTITTMDKWWGAKDGTPSEDQLDTWESGMLPIEEGTTGDDSPRENGIYLSGNSGSTSAGMTVLHSKTEGASTQYQEGAPRKWSTGYLGCHKWVQYTWRNETGNVQYDYASVNASNPINITFIGVKAEDSHVNVTSTQNINIGGVIGNTQLYEIKNGDTVTGRIEKGTINITSNNGSVVQNAGSMYGATVNLSAKNDLSNIAVTAGDSVNFTGIIKDIGSADVVVDNNYQAKGNVILNNFGGAKANGASLTATGDIHQASTNNLVQAARIDLISKDGEIAGLNKTSMRIQGGQADDVVGSDTMLASVNVQAKGNIDLIQIKGDLRVGTIYSEAGDVSATVPEGGIVDALPYESKTDRISDDELLQKWREMGLIPGADGKKTEEQKEKETDLAASRQAYSNRVKEVTEMYAYYGELKEKKAEHENKKVELQNQYNELNAQYETETDPKLKQELLIARDKVQVQINNEHLSNVENSLLTKYTTEFGDQTLDAFLASDDTTVKLKTACEKMPEKVLVWNPDQLLYSIQSKVINPHPGIVTSDKAVNFFGKNITLTVRDGAGLNSNTIKTIDLTTLGDMDSKGNLIHLDDLKALSTADASTVTWYASENKATIQERLAIGLQQSNNAGGKIIIAKYTNTNNGQNNIFVESRKRTDIDSSITQNFDMNLYMAYTTQGDVQINTWGNLYNAMPDNVADILPVILGKNIVINTGAAGTDDYGSIGTATKHMTIALGGGNLSATATGNIYLDNNDANPLWIASMSAGKENGTFSADSGNISIKSTSNIYLVEKDSDIQGFIRSESNGMISIHSDASIGSAEHVVRILNSSKDQKAEGATPFATNEGVISLTAGKDIYVEGVSTAEPNASDNYKQVAAGYFNLAELGSTDGNVQITLNGTLNLKEDVNVTKTFTLNINREAKIDKDITAKDIVINATNSIYLIDEITGGVVTDWVTLNGETVTLATSKLPVLTYGTKAYSEASLTGGIYQGNTTYYSSSADAYVSGKIDITNVNTQKVFSSKSKILANELKATASNGIYLGGKNDINNVVLDNSMNNVVYHNVADVDSSETGDVLTIGISHHNNPSDAIVGTIWVYNEEATKTQDSVQHAKPMAVTSGVYALNSIDLKSNGNLVNQYEIASIQGSVYLEAGYEGIVTGTTETFVKKGDLENYGSISANPKTYADIGTNKVDIYATGNLYNHGQGLNGLDVNIVGDDGVHILVLGNAVNEADIYSKDAYVYMGSDGTMVNRGTIKADGGFATIGADGISNYATIEARDNVFLISSQNIYNGVELSPNQTSANNNIHVYAGEDIFLLAIDGLDNRADLFAGIYGNGSASAGGNVYLDDFEILDSDKLSDAVKNQLQLFAGEYWDVLHDISRSSDADIKNSGYIAASYGGISGKGLVYLDSQGMTINSGGILSDNAQVFMDSSKDLINHGDIYVINDDTGITDCQVELLATGSVYNAGNIYVKGKGAVTLDADAVNADDLDLASKTIEEIRAIRTTVTVNKLNAQGQETGEMIRFSGVYNTGNIFATTGDVELKTYADLQSNGNIFTGNGSVTLNAAENVRNTGDMFVNGTNCEVKMVAENGNVVNTSDLLFKKDVFFSLTGNSLNIPSGNVIYAEGGIQLLAEKGNLYNSKELLSKGDIVLKAKGDIIIETDPWADESIYMDESSKMTRIKNIKTTGGSVTIEGRNVVNNMQVEAGTGITVKANAETDASGVVENTGTIKIQSNNGQFKTVSGDVKLEANGYWKHSAYKDTENPDGQKFSISNGGVNDLITDGGDIILHGTYSVENVGDIKAKKGGDSTKGNAFLTSDSGNIYNYEYADEEYLVFTEMDAAGGVTSKAVKDEWLALGGIRPRSIEVEGNITWKAVKVYNKAGQYADGDLEIDVNNGGYNGGKISVGGNVTLKCDKDNFTFTNSITAGGDITLLNTSGSLKILDGASMRAGKDININAGDYVESGIRIEAGEGVNVYSENGHIKVENGITANDGMIRVYSQNDTAATGSSTANVLLGGTLYSANGSINISTNSGGIQANNVFAKDLAAVASLGGDVTITGSTKGQKVTFYTEDEAAELSFEKVQFGDEIIMAANSGPGGRSIDMSQVEILSDNYKMGLYGAGGTTGKGNYTLDYEDVEGNVEISNLKGDTINIVANEEVKIDNVSVSREANIYTMGTKTKIYGTVGPTDAASNEIYYAPGGSQSINLHEVFFDDVHTGNPATRNKDKSPQVQKMMEDSSQFVTNHGGGKGMSLHIVDSSLQYGTGIVLMDTYGSNVMSNRYSVTDTMIFLENIKAQAQFDNYFNIGFNFYERYNNIYIPDVTVNSIGLSSKGQGSNGIVVVPAKEDEYEF